MTSLVDERPQVRAIGPGGEAATRKTSDWVFQGPWEKGDLIVLAGRLGIGLLGLLICWIGCSGTEKWVPQQGWTAGAIGALVLALSGVASWVQTGVRNNRDAQSALLPQVRSRFVHQAAADLVPVAVAVTSATGYVAGASMSRYHRADCLLAIGKSVDPVSKVDAENAGFLACGVCRP